MTDRPLNTINVASIDYTIAQILVLGGRVAHPIIPPVRHLAYCEDAEANLFGTMQFDPGAGQGD